MIIYKDLITGDEVISEAFPLKEIDGVVFEADCRNITVGGETFDTGANASAEEADEALDDNTQTEIDVVHSFQLVKTSFDKKSYLAALKGYMKAVKAKLQEKNAPADTITAFEKGAQAYVKEKLLPNFKDLDFYISQSMDPDGMIILMNYREDGITPYMIFWKHGLEGMKV